MRFFQNRKHAYILQLAIFLSCLLILSFVIAFEIDLKLSIQNTFRERTDSPMTLVFQFDREYLRLRNSINAAILSREPINSDELNLRLDILHSRLDLLRNSPAAVEIVAKKNVDILLGEVSAIYDLVVSIVSKPILDRDALVMALLKLDELQQPVQAMSFETNTNISIKIERQLKTELQQANLIIALSIALGATLIIVFLIYINRQKKLQELNLELIFQVKEKNAARLEAESANHSKTRFLAAASHDLRQPVSALTLYASILDVAVKPGNDKLVSNIKNCIDSLSKLLNNLFDVSSLEFGSFEPMLSVFSLDELCISMMASYSVGAAQKDLKLHCRHTHNIFLHTDVQLFKRVLGNLIDNALKFTTQGGVLVAVRRHAGQMWIEVWDTGLGIPEENISYIFEEFRQLGAASRNHGSGLGLSIVAKLAALLSLQIRVKSRPGQGSMFAIQLPIGEPPITHQPKLQISNSIFTIGIVEDNEKILHALTLALTSLGHTVFGGTSAKELLEQLGQSIPDIVISDYRLEFSLTGLDAITSLRVRFGQGLAAIVLTGESDPDLSIDLTAHAIAWYRKPIPLNSLQMCIEQAVRSGSSHATISA